MAEASLAETEYLLLVSRDLEYVTPAAVNGCFSEVAQPASMLHALRQKVEAK
jgi:four helix bundle protein